MIANGSNGSDDGWIFSTKITLKNGKVLYASQCGLKAFRFKPRSPKSQDDAKTNPKKKRRPK